LVVFNAPSTPPTYTLSLHDALPISLLEHDRRRIELLHSFLLSMPGTPVMYYGDEIGMGDNIHLGDRDGVRTPMQWTSDRNGGFRSEEHTSELQSRENLVCRLLLEKK